MRTSALTRQRPQRPLVSAEWATEDLADLDSRRLTRTLETLETPQGPEVVIAGRRYLNFSSNDYLGLANHPTLARAAQLALANWGTGAGASRLIVGNLSPHRKLEQRLAEFEGTEDAVVFTSGYAANVGTIGALVGEGDVIFSDELNHASLIDGCRLSRARSAVYRHGDMAHLESLIDAFAGRRRMVVTDSVFSMDGDLAPLESIAALCERHGLALLVDEAHATGVIGPKGVGLCAALGVQPDVRVGTLSKALGCSGAYVAASALVCQLVINRGRSFVFSTGISPAICAAAEAALTLCERSDARRAKLKAHTEVLARRLSAMGHDTRPSSAIIAVLLGSEERALGASQALREAGFLVKAIRPPTVPVGTSRLRIALSASHTKAHVEALADALPEALR